MQNNSLEAYILSTLKTDREFLNRQLISRPGYKERHKKLVKNNSSASNEVVKREYRKPKK